LFVGFGVVSLEIGVLTPRSSFYVSFNFSLFLMTQGNPLKVNGRLLYLGLTPNEFGMCPNGVFRCSALFLQIWRLFTYAALNDWFL
jgi:hypothetical protein